MCLQQQPSLQNRKEAMPFTKELLHSQMHAVAQTISPQPTVSQEFLAVEQKAAENFARAARSIHFCIIPSNMNSEFR